MCVCAKFQAKQTALTFSAQICPKMDLGLAIQKTIVEIRISILDIPCVPIFSQNEQLRIFRPKFVQKRILGSEFQKSKSGLMQLLECFEKLHVSFFSLFSFKIHVPISFPKCLIVFNCVIKSMDLTC